MAKTADSSIPMNYQAREGNVAMHVNDTLVSSPLHGQQESLEEVVTSSLEFEQHNLHHESTFQAREDEVAHVAGNLVSSVADAFCLTRHDACQEALDECKTFPMDYAPHHIMDEQALHLEVASEAN